jgi:hypothetical protein
MDLPSFICTLYKIPPISKIIDKTALHKYPLRRNAICKSIRKLISAGFIDNHLNGLYLSEMIFRWSSEIEGDIHYYV